MSLTPVNLVLGLSSHRQENEVGEWTSPFQTAGEES